MPLVLARESHEKEGKGHFAEEDATEKKISLWKHAKCQSSSSSD